MALVPLNIVAGEFADAPNNYRAGAVVQVKTTGGAFASIYADAAGTTAIPQDGSSNVTDSTGSFNCYALVGYYDVTISSVTKRVSASPSRHADFTDVNDAGAHTASAISMYGSDANSLLSGLNKHELIESANGTTSVIKPRSNNTAARVHVEPKGFIDNGTTAKTDWMFDDYNSDTTNYRIGAIFTKTGAGAGLNGENGAAVLNVKGTGQQWGVFPSWHLGFQDDSATGVPMKAYYFDTSDTAWRTPMTGMWRTGKSYTSGDYCLSAFKLYQASTTGTSGATAPTHSSGTVSDGTVDWLFVRDYQAALAAFSSCVIFGSRDKMPLFNQFEIPVQYGGHTVHHNGFRDKWMKAGNSAGLCWTGVRADSESWQVEMLDDDSRFQIFAGWTRKTGMATALATTAITNNSATPSIATLEKLTLSNTAATTITGFTGGRVNQIFYVEATNSNTTIQHNANIRLKAAVDLLVTDQSMLCFVRHSDGRYVQL